VGDSIETRLQALRSVVRQRLPRGESPASMARVRKFMEQAVLASERHGDIDFAGGTVWDRTSDRATDRFSHGFLWFADWPAAIRADPRVAEAAFELSMAWRSRAHAWRQDDESLAFHDETTAQRLIMHLAIIEHQTLWLTGAQLSELRDFIDETAALLLAEDFHAGLNNHGMFQDVSIVHWAALADWASLESRDDALELALARLAAYFRHAFTAEGVHVEHAPSYHLMVARQLSSHVQVLQALRHSSVEEFDALLRSTIAYATHAVTPGGTYPPVSDTTVKPLAGQAGAFDDAYFDFAVTRGKRGIQPTCRTLVLPQSGYAIHRSSWVDPNASYVYFSAAYNDAYHKHADENTLLLIHRGLELITEAGPYGYNYQDPLTRYGYSQYAHSTLVVDGVSIPRHGGPLSAVTMREYPMDGAGFHVTGRNARLANAVHERTVRVQESEGAVRVLVDDSISAGVDHTYELLWHVGPGLGRVSLCVKPEGDRA